MSQINSDLRWDNIWCLAENMEAAAYACDFDSVEEFQKNLNDDPSITIIGAEVERLPEGFSTCAEVKANGI